MKFTATSFVLLALKLANTEAGLVNYEPLDGSVGMCDSLTDCDTDAQCKPGLICADVHKEELIKAGFDARKANCPYTFTVRTQYTEVCFDGAILKPSGGGGGGKNL